jgi:hypothetical protein
MNQTQPQYLLPPTTDQNPEKNPQTPFENARKTKEKAKGETEPFKRKNSTIQNEKKGT